MIDVILNRRSIRDYQDKEIPEEVLSEILEAGRQSPSAANRQPYHTVVVTDTKLRQELGGLLSRFLKKAPVILVGCANPKAMLTGKWATVDTTIKDT